MDDLGYLMFNVAKWLSYDDGQYIRKKYHVPDVWSEPEAPLIFMRVTQVISEDNVDALIQCLQELGRGDLVDRCVVPYQKRQGLIQ